MRSLRRRAALLLFFGCIPLPGCVHVKVVVTAENQARDALTRARGIFAGFLQSHSTIPCGSRSCYSTGDLASDASNVRDRLRREFPKEGEALRATVDDVIAAEMARLQPRAAARVYLVKLQAPAGPAVDAASADSALSRIIAFIDRILSYDKLALPLSITSSPKNANFEMQIQENLSTRLTTRTDNMLPNVWRGIYTAVASKPGYKTARDTVDLINDGRTNLRCELQLEGSREESVCQRH